MGAFLRFRGRIPETMTFLSEATRIPGSISRPPPGSLSDEGGGDGVTVRLFPVKRSG